MSKYFHPASLVIMCCALFCQRGLAQAALPDSSSQQNALNNAITLYKTSMGIQAPLYSGPEYYFYDPHIKGSAYYMDVNAFSKGSVYYEHTLYNNIDMLYDLNLDEVAALFPNRVSKFILLKSRVNSFDYLGSHFINIDADTLAEDAGLKSGYYRLLYNGRSEILVKYSKSLQTTTSNSNFVENYFSLSKDFYFKRNNIYYNANNRGSVLDVFKDRKKELKKFIKANNLEFKDHPEETMLKIATWYDNLSK
ncbi:MAG TPA: hypothetical protein VHA56_08960 [Mucilaginibacter sp.]|nr:hypothetical protein [Mucilaginibacter sp.]